MSDDRAPRAVHTLVITVDPPGGNPDPPEPAGSTYAVECPGVTDDSGCRTYWECIECNAAYARDDEAISEALEADGEAHGIEHRQVGDVGWATPSDDCWAQHADELPEAVEDLFDRAKRGLEPGRYAVTISDGDPLTFAFAAGR